MMFVPEVPLFEFLICAGWFLTAFFMFEIDLKLPLLFDGFSGNLQ